MARRYVLAALGILSFAMLVTGFSGEAAPRVGVAVQESAAPAPEKSIGRIQAQLDRVMALEVSHRSLEEVADELGARTGVAFVLDGKLTPAQIQSPDPNAAVQPLPSPEGGESLGGYSCAFDPMPLGKALSLFLGYYDLDYAVLGETVVIATAERARELRAQEPVKVDLKRTPLTDALARLSGQTHTDIVFAPAALPRAERPLTIRLDPMPLQKAVALLAELAELKAVAWGKATLITTADHAAELAKEHSRPHAGKKQQEVGPAASPTFGLCANVGFGGGMVGGFGLGGPAALDGGPVRRARPAPQLIPGESKKQNRQPGSAAIRKLLATPIETKDFQNPMTLKEALGLFYEHFARKGHELPILVDVDAFVEDNPDAEPIYDTQIQFPPYPKKMSMATALRLVLNKVKTKNAAYLVRPSHIEVTSFIRAEPKAQSVEAEFAQGPLNEALQDLADQTGISIVIDVRAGPRAAVTVTASFPPDTSLLSAVHVLADMADLKVMQVENLLYVTLRSNSTVFPPIERGRVRRLDAVAE